MVAAIGTALGAHVRRSSELTHRDHQRVIQQITLLEIGYQRGQQVIEQGQQAAEPLRDSPVNTSGNPVGVPRPRGGVIAQIKGHETRSGFDQSPGQQGLLAPEVLAILLDRRRIFLGQVKRVASTPAQQHVDRLGPVGVNRVERPSLVNITTQAVKSFHELLAIANSTHADTLGKLEQVRPGHLPGVHSRLVVYRQLARLVGNERIVLLAQPAADGRVPGVSPKRDVGGHPRIVGTTVFCDERTDGRIHPAILVPTRSRGAMAGLERHVRFVVALVCIHGPHHRELVEHRGLLGQAVADEDARLGRLDHAEGTPVVERPLRLRVPGVDVAGATTHPQQDHRLAARHLSTRLRRMSTLGQQPGQAQSGQARHRHLHHATTVQVQQTFTTAWIEVGKSVIVSVHR